MSDQPEYDAKFFPQVQELLISIVSNTNKCLRKIARLSDELRAYGFVSDLSDLYGRFKKEKTSIESQRAPLTELLRKWEMTLPVQESDVECLILKPSRASDIRGAKDLAALKGGTLLGVGRSLIYKFRDSKTKWPKDHVEYYTAYQPDKLIALVLSNSFWASRSTAEKTGKEYIKEMALEFSKKQSKKQLRRS